jgi:hypothetical protein
MDTEAKIARDKEWAKAAKMSFADTSESRNNPMSDYYTSTKLEQMDYSKPAEEALAKFNDE